MGLLKLAALGALGFAGYKYFERAKQRNGAFAADQAGGDNFAQIRDAGTAAMADKTLPSDWSPIDQLGDESFPASDPPANY